MRFCVFSTSNKLGTVGGPYWEFKNFDTVEDLYDFCMKATERDGGRAIIDFHVDGDGVNEGCPWIELWDQPREDDLWLHEPEYMENFTKPDFVRHLAPNKQEPGFVETEDGDWRQLGPEDQVPLYDY